MKRAAQDACKTIKWVRTGYAYLMTLTVSPEIFMTSALGAMMVTMLTLLRGADPPLWDVTTLMESVCHAKLPSFTSDKLQRVTLMGAKNTFLGAVKLARILTNWGTTHANSKTACFRATASVFSATLTLSCEWKPTNALTKMSSVTNTINKANVLNVHLNILCLKSSTNV